MSPNKAEFAMTLSLSLHSIEIQGFRKTHWMKNKVYTKTMNVNSDNTISQEQKYLRTN